MWHTQGDFEKIKSPAGNRQVDETLDRRTQSRAYFCSGSGAGSLSGSEVASSVGIAEKSPEIVFALFVFSSQ